MKRTARPSLLFAYLLCTSAALSDAAWADDAPATTLTGNVAVTSDYLFRGLSQTGQEPALQAGIEAAHPSGFYAGAWGSNVSWLSDLSSSDVPVSNSLEIDLYAGFRHALTDHLGLDVGLYTYYYPGDYPHGFVRPYTTEAYVGLSSGPFSAKYYHALSNLFGYADSDGSGYLDLSANVEVSPGWTLNAHAGRQRVRRTSAASYTDWKLGLTWAFAPAWTLAAAYQDTNAERAVYTNPQREYLGRATGVVTLTRTF